ncbi:hypothetical protein SLEP1_g46020 [Rubroshorea leprosula]|uniref:Bifunctional inhibitor/plant lipid transfer protein/seed storage helical domain-containing protein n=1 Tax=Rubroshorea leprosula TaxID=152421 RepID=A0AAV5LKW8_9ROSI|nr:hypothetical protein SLEP1_g46020 [Rubroshorea leprosula]
MASKVMAMSFIFMIFMVVSLPPIYACGHCMQPHPPPRHHPAPPKRPTHPHPHPPFTKPPPHHGGHPPSKKPPVIVPPIIIPPPVTNPPVIITPPIINPPITNPPVVVLPPPSPYPPYTGSPDPGGVPAPPTTQPTCPINALKLGLCVDVLGGLVHVGLGDPVENVCCPVLKGLLELEAAICLCTTIRLKLLNLNIFIPLALQALITCGMTPPPGFVCPPLL